MTEGEVSNRMFRTGAGHAQQRLRQRGRLGFPRLALDAEQLETFEQALQGDVPTLLRRAWEDELDDRR